MKLFFATWIILTVVWLLAFIHVETETKEGGDVLGASVCCGLISTALMWALLTLLQSAWKWVAE